MNCQKAYKSSPVQSREQPNAPSRPTYSLFILKIAGDNNIIT